MLPQNVLMHAFVSTVGFRVVRPLSLPTAEECKRYELTPEDIRLYVEYRKAASGM